MDRKLRKIEKLDIEKIVVEMFGHYGNPKKLKEEDIKHFLNKKYNITTREEILYFLILAEGKELGIIIRDPRGKVKFERMKKKEIKQLEKSDEKTFKQIYDHKRKTGQL